MKILWIVNITMPDTCEKIGMNKPVVGGWLTGYQDALLSRWHQELELHIIEPASIGTPQEVITQHKQFGNNIFHHLFPSQWLQSASAFSAKPHSQLTPLSNQLAALFIQINESVQPDVVHIHGTEYPHSLVWIEACGATNVLVSIQGLTSVYARYYMAGLTPHEQCPTLHDIRYHVSLAKGQALFEHRGEAEKRLLAKVNHVAGRTAWDHSHAKAINPDIQYHTLQEVLRTEFYDQEKHWALSSCNRHTIFVSQSHYPIKGLHKLLEAMPLILSQYPDTRLRIVGEDPTQKQWWQMSTYGKALKQRIEKPCNSSASMRKHIEYLGQLSAQQMADEYQKAHLFVCPSAIENSSNSVCEAQMIGTPVVASYVGGLMDLICHGKTGLLYRFEETEMLAQAVCQIFSDDEYAQMLSEQSREAAKIRHDRLCIADTLYNIYKEIAHGC